MKGLLDRPKSPLRKRAPTVRKKYELDIIRIRNNNPTWSKEKIAIYLEKEKGIKVSPSTIYRASFIKRIQANKERCLCFLKYPENLRKHIYTTNPVERINSMIEKARINLGGYFQSAEILEINILVQRDILKNNKWSKPVPALKGSSYEVLQIFNRRFCYETQNY